MNYRNILTERIEKTALITLNRPEKLNAMSYELACEVDEELTTIENDDGVCAVILTGAYRAAFRRWRHPPNGQIDARGIGRAQRGSRSRHLAPCHVPKPIIGAINGLAYGAWPC